MYGLTGMAFSAVALVVGAIMYFAVTTQGTGFKVSTVGVILMVAGAVGLLVSGIVYATSGRPGGSRRQSFHRQTVDAQGRSTEVHEEVR